MTNKTFAPFIRLVRLYLDPEGPLNDLWPVWAAMGAASVWDNIVPIHASSLQGTMIGMYGRLRGSWMFRAVLPFPPTHLGRPYKGLKRPVSDIRPPWTFRGCYLEDRTSLGFLGVVVSTI